MISAFLLLLCNSLFLSLHLSGGTGSFPKPLTAAQEREYLRRCAEGDMEARNLLVEHNLRLVAHIMKKYYTQVGYVCEPVHRKCYTIAAEQSAVEVENHEPFGVKWSMYYFCAFRCFTAASTSSSFCSVEQGSFRTFFST